MANILYIHGFNSNGNSRSFLALKSEITNHNFYSADFDLLDIHGTFEKINTLCKEYDIHLIIGKSLGGFYTLAYEGPQDKIVINPCIKPWLEIPKIENNIPQNILDEWQLIFEKTEINIHADQRTKAFGIFGKEDELFSYKDYFDKYYGPVNVGMQKSFLVPGKHHIEAANLKIAVQKGIDYYTMMEQYNFVFPLAPLYHQIINSNEEDELPFNDTEKKEIIERIENYQKLLETYKKNTIFE